MATDVEGLDERGKRKEAAEIVDDGAGGGGRDNGDEMEVERQVGGVEVQVSGRDRSKGIFSG